MAAPPLLVFDLDGTLVDTAGDLIGTLNHILSEESIPPVPLATARPMLGAGARALIERGLSAAGRSVSRERLEEMYRAFLARYEAHIADESRVFPGVEPALDRFESAGWAFAVCTNKIEHPSVCLLTELGLAQRFRAICGQNTFAFCKPDPRALVADDRTRWRRSAAGYHGRRFQDRHPDRAGCRGARCRRRFRLHRPARFGVCSQSRHLAFRRTLGRGAVALGG